MLYYLILVHNNLNQLELLIKKIKTDNSEVYVHIDKKVSDFKKIEGVHYIKNRQSISWGGVLMIKAEIIGFSEIYKNMKKGDHVVLISGQCFPIKNVKSIEEYIENLGNKSCMTYSKAGKFVERIDRYYFYDNHFHVPKIIDKLIFSLVGLFIKLGTPHRVPAINLVIGMIVSFVLPRRKYLVNNYEIYKGDQWLVLSYEHIKWVLSFLDSKEGKKVLSCFEYTTCGDEMFFQLIMLNNDKIKREINNELLRYIVREKNANSPNILTMDDLEDVKESGKLFARKFDINVDNKIIEELDKI